MADSDDDFDFDELRERWQASRKKEFDFDEWAKEIENHPAFMTKLPEDGQLSEAAAALQALKYDEDDDIIVRAKTYKDDGNKYFELKKYRWATDSYTQGIKLKCPDAKLSAVLYGNRAACHFRYENYRSALKDCVLARKFDPSYSKVIIRGIECLLKLRQPAEALLWIRDAQGLLLGRDDAKKAFDFDELEKMEAEAKKMMTIMARDERKARKEAEIERNKKMVLMNALKHRGIRFRDPINLVDPDKFSWLKLEVNLPGEERVASVYLDDVEGVLVWPVVFLYPEFGQTDFIREFRESESFMDHVAVMFASPAPWDTNQSYTADTVTVYFESFAHPGTLIQVPLAATLSSVLSHAEYSIASGSPSFLVYSSKSSKTGELLAKYSVSTM